MDFIQLIVQVGLSGALVAVAFLGLIKGWFYPKSQIDFLLARLAEAEAAVKTERQRADIATEAMIKLQITGEINAKLLTALPDVEKKKEAEPEEHKPEENVQQQSEGGT